MELSVLDRAFFFCLFFFLSEASAKTSAFLDGFCPSLLLCTLKRAAQGWLWEPLVPEEEQSQKQYEALVSYGWIYSY